MVDGLGKAYGDERSEKDGAFDCNVKVFIYNANYHMSNPNQNLGLSELELNFISKILLLANLNEAK